MCPLEHKACVICGIHAIFLLLLLFFFLMNQNVDPHDAAWKKAGRILAQICWVSWCILQDTISECRVWHWGCWVDTESFHGTPDIFHSGDTSSVLAKLHPSEGLDFTWSVKPNYSDDRLRGMVATPGLLHTEPESLDVMTTRGWQAHGFSQGTTAGIWQRLKLDMVICFRDVS